MLVIGPHISTAKGYTKAAREALEMGANTFQFFSRNPRGGKMKKLDPKDVSEWESFMKEHDFGPVLAHAPYTLNMASTKEDVRDFALRCFKEDLERLEALPCSLYNFHPGSFLKGKREEGIDRIVEILNKTVTENTTTTILLELMSGKGTEIGRDFKEIKAILDRVEFNEKFGVCLDTCHVYSAGYDIKEDLSGVLDSFDKIIGLDRLKAIHVNDSMTEFGSGKDRHEKLGQGSLGEDFFIKLLGESRLKGIPLYLETPNEKEGYIREIAFMRGAYKALNLKQ